MGRKDKRGDSYSGYIMLDPAILRAIVETCDARHIDTEEELTEDTTIEGGADEGRE